MRLAVPTMSRVPTRACTTPPPLSPAGAGVRVRKLRERLPAPLSTRFSRMKNSGMSATITAPIISPTMKLLITRRSIRRFTAERLSQGAAPGPRAAGHSPDQEPGSGVHQDSHQKKHERDVSQRREMEIAHRLREFVGDRGGHGVARSKQRGGDLVPVADYHGDRHGLTQ